MNNIVFRTALALAVLTATPALAGQRFPEFPLAVKMTAAAKVGNTVYAGLGTAGTAWFALDLSHPHAQWQALAPFPDQQRENASAVAIGTSIYVFNGQGKAKPADQQQIMFDTVWKYDTVSNTWSQLATRSPMGGLGAGVTTVDGQTILFFGGANKAIFDGYFADYFKAPTDVKLPDGASAAAKLRAWQDDVDERYFSQRPQDYLFTAQVLSYHPASNRWRNLGLDPKPVTLGAAVAVQGNTVTLIGGELKPGLRSPAARTVTVNGEHLSWGELSPMPAIAGEPAQEGIAGAFAGYSNGVLLAAGGANFPGAWRQFNSGQLYAHQGLSKTWRTEIYAAIKGQWRVVGQLPAPLGYASYLQLEDGVLVLGGELPGGAGSRHVFLMKWNGHSVDIVP